MLPLARTRESHFQSSPLMPVRSRAPRKRENARSALECGSASYRLSAGISRRQLRCRTPWRFSASCQRSVVFRWLDDSRLRPLRYTDESYRRRSCNIPNGIFLIIHRRYNSR